MRLNCPTCNAPIDSFSNEVRKTICPTCFCQIDPKISALTDKAIIESDRDEFKPANKIWGLLRATHKIDDFAKRLLLILPRSPITVFLWESSGCPCSLNEFDDVLSLNNESSSAALNFLYDYLTYYRETTTTLFKKPVDDIHLMSLADSLILHGHNLNDRTQNEYKLLLLKLVENIDDASWFIWILDYFLPPDRPDDIRNKYKSIFIKSPCETLYKIFELLKNGETLS